MLPTPDTIVHIGAGGCTELDTWRETGASRIVLVEPNPELLPELRRRTHGIARLKSFGQPSQPTAGHAGYLPGWRALSRRSG